MIKVRNLGLLLALSSVAVLPACSMFGGNDNSRSSSAASPSQGYASAQQPNYSSQQQAMEQQPLTPDTIRQVQQTLQQQGMYRGRLDGVWGPATQAAVRSYQQRNNLNASGQLDQQTLASMNMGNNQNYGSNSTGPQPTNQANGGNDQTQPMNQNQPMPQQNAQSNQQNNTTTR
jgi:peptidoglycan hydrolase-like protein with peptidoglycan-binding domain